MLQNKRGHFQFRGRLAAVSSWRTFSHLLVCERVLVFFAVVFSSLRYLLSTILENLCHAQLLFPHFNSFLLFCVAYSELSGLLRLGIFSEIMIFHSIRAGTDPSENRKEIMERNSRQ